MSTPFVGIQKMVQKNAPATAWPAWSNVRLEQPTPPNSTHPVQSQNPYTPRQTPSLQIAKQNLIDILKQQYGVESVQVGRFMMALSPTLPVAVLRDATELLKTQYDLEPTGKDLAKELQFCLDDLIEAMDLAFYHR